MDSLKLINDAIESLSNLESNKSLCMGCGEMVNVIMIYNDPLKKQSLLICNSCYRKIILKKEQSNEENNK